MTAKLARRALRALAKTISHKQREIRNRAGAVNREARADAEKAAKESRATAAKAALQRAGVLPPDDPKP